MNGQRKSRVPELVEQHEAAILKDWIGFQLAFQERHSFRTPEGELHENAEQFLGLFRQAIRSGMAYDPEAGQWDGVRDFLTGLSRSHALQGVSPSQTAMFVLSLKQPLFSHIRELIGHDAAAMDAEIWIISTVIDNLGLFTTEIYQQARENVISRQQEELMELSTPVVQLWSGILALPLIGTLDSARTQVVMENLLDQVVATGARFAIIDITGVPTVDTLVAQHLMKTVAAARLMGAECFISGIRPQIAQTVVHLGIDLSEITTRASLADALALALRRSGLAVVEHGSRTSGR